MEQEHFFTGYCRVLDCSRMVAVVLEGRKLLEVECCYGACLYEPNCPIAEKIRELTD